MIMESPVRICLGAVLVVNLLLLSSTTVSGDALPRDNSSTTVKDERPGRVARVNNSTWVGRRPKTADVALNELNGKDSTSEENSDITVKYKQRGRVRFGAKPASTTEAPIRRVKTTSTEAAAKLIIVTPTPEVKKPTQIMNSMRVYKRTKMPAVSSSTGASVASESQENDYENERDDEVDSYEKFTTGKFDDSNFYTIPDYSKENKSKKDNIPTVSTFSSYLPKISLSPKDNSNDEPYKSEFFDFSTDLTTPRNDFFDKKFQEISTNIKKNLDAIKSKSSKNASSSQKVIKQNVGLQKLNNGSPNNKSTVIFKNTKEIRLLDNESAGSANQELSDVQGTSIYYEMSVLSTETYAINNSNEDDCDNETVPDPTVPSAVEIVTTRSTQSTFASASTRSSYPDPDIANVVQMSTTIPESSSTATSQPFAAQNTISPTEATKVNSSGYRNRSYSKRLNLTGAKESNSVTPKTDQISGQSYRQNTRKFHYTTPKVKPIWMAPRRNVTRTSYTRTPIPTTIYSEHFDISDKYTTTSRPNTSNRTMLTTVSSDIDPIVQGDVMGVKKVVHSQSIADNSIPSLWKRGSTKFSSSTEPPRETESGVSDLEIPPTLTAWALASLRSPPSMASPVKNGTRTVQKNIDENELQKVGVITDKKNGVTIAVTTPTSVTLSNDLVSKTMPEIDQNKLSWKPLDIPTTTVNNQADVRNESTSESQPAESNISVKSSDQPATESINEINKKEFKPSWIPVADKVKDQVAAEQTQETIPPVDATKSTGFESITKLPAGTKTPQEETVASFVEDTNTNVLTTTDYEITTIRFSYVPTEEATEKKTVDNATDTVWHPVFPTRTKVTTIKDEPITTYRPKYESDSDEVIETTTYIPETTPQIEVTSPMEKNVSESVSRATESEQMTTETIMTEPMTTKLASEKPTTSIPEETTRISFEVVTEIQKDVNTSPVTDPSETETPPSEIRESSSEENSGSNEVITLETTKVVPTIPPATTAKPETTSKTTTEVVTETTERIATLVVMTTSEKIIETTKTSEKVETTTEEEMEMTTKSVNELEDLTNYGEEVTTEASTRLVTDEAGSGAAIAIAVSTIGVMALILLVGLLLIARKRSRRGVYAQRCTPVSLDAYSLDSVSVGHRKGNHRLRASKRSYGNPAYDDEVTSHPMQYAALANFAMDVDSVTAEFSEIPSVSVRPDEVPPGCEDKNRYSNVLPLPETRVPLKRVGDDPTSEYINANFIMGPGNIRNYYIACQAPMSNTVSDFWRMIWEQNSRLIVMLTEYMENGVEKCYEYLPPSEVSDNKRTFGDYQVILKKREQRDKYAISSVQLINLNSRTWREVTHLWYFWPAKGVPDDYDSVIDFLSEMRSYMKISQTAKEYDEDGVEVIYGDQSRSSYGNLSKLRSDENGSGNGLNVYSPAKAEEQLRRNATNGTLGRMKAASEVEGVRPCTVTCASGAGRSAAMIAADICARALCAGRADVPRTVRELRQQRPHSMHNRMHYVFLYKLLSEYGNKLMGGGVDTI